MCVWFGEMDNGFSMPRQAYIDIDQAATGAANPVPEPVTPAPWTLSSEDTIQCCWPVLSCVTNAEKLIGLPPGAVIVPVTAKLFPFGVASIVPAS